MSSPVFDDGDKRAMYIPPWAREDQRDDEERRRLQSEIVAAAERLKPAQPPQPPQPPPSRAPLAPSPKIQTRFLGDRPGMPSSDTGEKPFDVEEAIRAAWQPSTSSLDPTPLPPPPQEKLGGPTWGMVSRLAGAGGFAAIVALFVVGAIPLPSIEFSLSRDTKDANAAAPSPPVGAVAAKQQVAALPAAPAAAPAPTVLAVASQPPAAPMATVGIAANVASPFAPPPKPVAVEPVAPKAPSALPEPRVLDYMSREEIAALLKRGQDLVGTGDIASGRLLLTRAAEAGDAQASFALASTYDAAVIAGLGVIGNFPDPVKARAWYTKAAEQGSTEAARRLEQPHLRQR